MTVWLISDIKPERIKARGSAGVMVGPARLEPVRAIKGFVYGNGCAKGGPDCFECKLPDCCYEPPWKHKYDKAGVRKTAVSEVQ